MTNEQPQPGWLHCSAATGTASAVVGTRATGPGATRAIPAGTITTARRTRSRITGRGHRIHVHRAGTNRASLRGTRSSWLITLPPQACNRRSSQAVRGTCIMGLRVWPRCPRHWCGRQWCGVLKLWVPPRTGTVTPPALQRLAVPQHLPGVLPRVGTAHMGRRGRGLNAGVGAKGARVGLLPPVPPLVHQQVAALGAAVIAEAALEGLLPCVGACVHPYLGEGGGARHHDTT
jgi:hypothetical protein